MNPAETKKIVGEKVRALVKAWNRQYEKKQNVNINSKDLYIIDYKKPVKILYILFFYSQPLNDRSPFSEDVVISRCLKNDKKNNLQSTKLVLGISNWHFNRDTQHLVEGPQCKLDDINISFKLASSAFSAEEAGRSASTTSKASSTSNALSDDSQLKYDRNGAIVPYAAFVSLMETRAFHDYMKKLQNIYEQKEGVIPGTETNLDTENNDAGGGAANQNEGEGEEEEEEEEEGEISKKGKKRSRVLSETEEEPEIEQPAEPPSENNQHQQQQQQSSIVTVAKTTTTRRGTKKTLTQNVDT